MPFAQGVLRDVTTLRGEEALAKPLRVDQTLQTVTRADTHESLRLSVSETSPQVYL